MRINTNISALNAYRNLYDTDMRLNKSLERLSSGCGLTVRPTMRPDWRFRRRCAARSAA